MKNFISINFIYLRNILYLNRKEFAEKFNISYGAMSSYERDISLPPIDLIQSICNELKVSIDDFINKDLSKLKNDTYLVSEPNNAYHKIDKKTEIMMQNIIDSQSQIIESKQELVIEKEKRIVILEKTIERLETLLNQNGLN